MYQRFSARRNLHLVEVEPERAAQRASLLNVRISAPVPFDDQAEVLCGYAL